MEGEGRAVVSVLHEQQAAMVRMAIEQTGIVLDGKEFRTVSEFKGGWPEWYGWFMKEVVNSLDDKLIDMLAAESFDPVKFLVRCAREGRKVVLK